MSHAWASGGLTKLAVLASFVAALGCDASLVSVGAWVEDSTAAAEKRDATADADTSRPDATDSGEYVDDAEQEEAEPPGDEPTSGEGIYLEAESAQPLSGFTIGNDSSASGGHFIESPPGVQSDNVPGAARARYDIDIGTPGQYVFWGRLHTPDSNHNRFWIQVDDGTWYLWRLTTGDIWYWNPFHDNNNYYMSLKFDLTAGPHHILIANAIDKTQLDRLYLTARGDMPQQVDSPCQPPNSIQVDGGCIPSCGSQKGMTCGMPGCAGRTIVPTKVYDCVICCL